jgi:Putative collagen-binding domain of a collagenase
MTSLSNDQCLDRIPDQSLIDGDEGGMKGAEGAISNRLQATRGSKGDYAMIYSANGRNIRVKMNRLTAPSMNAFWFNPRNGKWRIKDRDFTDCRPFLKNIPSGPTAPIREFDPPGKVADGNDWVLVLKAAK